MSAEEKGVEERCGGVIELDLPAHAGQSDVDLAYRPELSPPVRAMHASVSITSSSKTKEHDEKVLISKAPCLSGGCTRSMF
jgi:hypothetical protein